MATLTAIGSTSARTLPRLSPAARAARWNEEDLRRAVELLQRRALGHGVAVPAAVVDAIVRLGLQPDVQAALRGRNDPEEAVRDLATRYAFQALMVDGQSFDALDPLSQALISRTLDLIYKRARQVAEHSGEDPLDEDLGLLLSICKSLAHYVPKKPMGAHISWKLRHYEGAVSRAMRQIENLVRYPEVTEAFVAYVLDAPVPDVLKAHLLQLARGGGRSGVEPEAVIRFFALPATVAFVRRFASSVQTARTLYDAEEYAGLPWQGRRRLPAGHRQGYLEAALARCERRNEVSLDTEDYDLHDLARPARATELSTSPQPEALRRESFERWLTRRALDERPEDRLWQTAGQLYVHGLTADEIVARGLAGEEEVTAARQRVEALCANTDVWQVWLAATLG